MNFFQLDGLLEITKSTGFKKREIDPKITLVGETIKRYIDGEIYHFYPKCITSDKEGVEPTFELIVILENKIIVGTYVDENKVRLKTFNLSNITSLDLLTSHYEGAELKIHFCNDEKLEFDSNKNSNTHWKRDYDEKVKEISKFIFNK
jgi:hypothetical protein